MGTANEGVTSDCWGEHRVRVTHAESHQVGELRAALVGNGEGNFRK